MKKFILTALVLTALTAFAQTPPATVAASLQSIIDNSLPTGTTNPGMIVRIEVPGKWTWSSQSGYAINGMTSGQPASLAAATHQFRAGSITKVFCSVAIFQLQEAGLLNIEDDILLHLRSTLVNDTIQPSETTRIRHLLNHTSGIANSSENTTCQLDALSNLTRYFSLEEAVYCGASQGENFPAEFAWGYSNTNYSLLAMIVEKVSGKPFDQYITDSIINPLGLTNTLMPTTDQLASAHMGCYYDFGAPLGLKDMTIVDGSLYRGWANIVSTTEDLISFQKALRNGNVLSAASLTQMETIYPTSFDYGMGLEYYDLSGKTYYGHSGNVGNTSGMFYCNLTTPEIPNGYYISYNYNYEGVSTFDVLDQPVYNVLASITATTGMEEMQRENVKVYPNPSQSTITIQQTNAEYALLRDLTGKTVLTIQLNNGNTSVDVSAPENGMYTLELYTNETLTGLTKLIKN